MTRRKVLSLGAGWQDWRQFIILPENTLLRLLWQKRFVYITCVPRRNAGYQNTPNYKNTNTPVIGLVSVFATE